MCFVCKILDAINEYQAVFIILFTGALVRFASKQFKINKKQIEINNKQKDIQEDQIKVDFFKLRFDFFKRFYEYVQTLAGNESAFEKYSSYKAECRILFDEYINSLVITIEQSIFYIHNNAKFNASYFDKSTELQELKSKLDEKKNVNTLLTFIEQSFAEDFNFSKYFKKNDIVDIDLE